MIDWLIKRCCVKQLAWQIQQIVNTYLTKISKYYYNAIYLWSIFGCESTATMCMKHNVVCRCYDDKHAYGPTLATTLYWSCDDCSVQRDWSVLPADDWLTCVWRRASRSTSQCHKATRFIDGHIIIMPRWSTVAWITNYDSTKNKLSYCWQTARRICPVCNVFQVYAVFVKYWIQQVFKLLKRRFRPFKLVTDGDFRHYDKQTERKTWWFSRHKAKPHTPVSFYNLT